ncbi:armadillo-type protein [Vararia minispora EC-137]|uniref:Armadillo-type protein n=1 Tax=Vararia minispora EC-137 TaxID=1314806 RepID=A0ACB8QUV9_9AGAM|nr:armadillo-type protein [Vararia minispora EC-137]
MATVDPSISPTNQHPASDDRKQSPPAFLDLADSAARLGTNMPDISARVELKRMEHERQRALHRKLFEDQMRALEQQQQQELLALPVENGNHFAVSAPTTPPRVNAVLADDISPGIRTSFAHSSVGPDMDALSQHFVASSNSDKRKSVTYAPAQRSPEIPTPGSLSANSGQGFARAVAKSMPASRRTSASEHDEEIAGHLQNLSLAGEARHSPLPTQQPSYFTRDGRLDSDAAAYGAIYNAGMMLDEQLDQEMHNAMRHLPTSDDDKYQTALAKLQTSSAALDLAQAPAGSRNSYGGPAPRSAEAREKASEWPQFIGSSPRPDSLATRGERRTSANPVLNLGDLSSAKLGTVSASATPQIPQLTPSVAHLHAPGSRRGSPASFGDLSVTTRSVPATPLGAGVAIPASLMAKGPVTPISPAEANPLTNARLSSSHLSDSPLATELPTSLSRAPSAQFDFNGIPQQYDDVRHFVHAVENNFVDAAGATYGLNGSAPYGFDSANANGATGSTALYHHNGTRYGLALGRPNGGDSKMNGLHGPKHKRGDMDREFNRFAGTRLEDLVGEIPSLCKDQHGCRYLQKKLEEGIPEHRDMIFRETFQHFAELMTDPFGNYLCQKLLEFSTDEQRNVICESVAQDLVNISLNMHGTRAVQKMIDFLSTRRQTDGRYPGQIHSIIVALSLHVVVLIKDLNGNHVIQKCLNKLAPEDNQFIYNAVAANCVEVATHRHGCCVLQRCIDHASEHQRIQLVNEITYNALTLVQDPYGNYVVQYILDLNDNRFSDAVIRQFTGNVCALSVQKFSSNVIEKCIRVAEHSTRKMLIEELLNRTRLEKLLRDSYGNYCVQTALDYAEPGQRALLVEGIRPVLPLIRNTPYGKRIQNKLQREQMDHFGGYHSQQALVNMTLANHGMGVARNPLADVYAASAYSTSAMPIVQHIPHAIDGYVLQGHSSHNAAQVQGGAYGAFAGANAYPAVGLAGGMGDYQRSSYGYGI